MANNKPPPVESDTSRDTSFGLEITKGEWGIEQNDFDIEFDQYRTIGPIGASSEDGDHFICVEKDDAKAICAVPQLLEVATMARDYLNSYKLGNDGIRNAQADLNVAIKKLEEKLDES